MCPNEIQLSTQRQPPAAPPRALPMQPAGRAVYAVELLEPRESDTVLDLGCFNGAIEYHFLKDRVRGFHGVDVNESAVREARQWLERWTSSHPDASSDRWSFQVAQGERLPFADGTFSKAICLDVFEHVDDEQKVADEIYRVLKPGGVLVLSVPHNFLNFLDPDELTRGARNFVRRYIRPKPLLNHPKHRHYGEEDLRRFFHRFNFDVVHRCGTPVFWTLAMAYTGMGLPDSVVRRLSAWTAPLENWDYRTRLPTGFNIMVKLRKPA